MSTLVMLLVALVLLVPSPVLCARLAASPVLMDLLRLNQVHPLVNNAQLVSTHRVQLVTPHAHHVQLDDTHQLMDHLHAQNVPQADSLHRRNQPVKHVLLVVTLRITLVLRILVNSVQSVVTTSVNRMLDVSPAKRVNSLPSLVQLHVSPAQKVTLLHLVHLLVPNVQPATTRI